MLLEHAERHAVAFGVREVWLGVMVQNMPAHAMVLNGSG